MLRHIVLLTFKPGGPCRSAQRSRIFERLCQKFVHWSAATVSVVGPTIMTW